MEKTVSVEEKIRKAEEIYNRRNGNTYISNNKKEKRKSSIKNRMIKQMIICFIIYAIFYTVDNRQYFLSQEFLGKVQEIASKNEYLNKVYNAFYGYLQKYLKLENVDNQNENIEKEENQDINSNENSDENNTDSNAEQNIEDIQTNENNIGGAGENVIEDQEEVATQNEKSQMELDAESIKQNISFIKPIEGRISSVFGWRSPTTSTVPKYHTGLDLAAVTGTVIKSATDGTVILASSEGDYGKHYKIQNGDTIIIYAHCSKLYLKQGDTVKQGDAIAEVGSTGNSTGPHLHFEIRKEERLVDPQLILDI